MERRGISGTWPARFLLMAMVLLFVASGLVGGKVVYSQILSAPEVLPGIAVGVSASPTTINTGESVTYTAGVTNTGPIALTIWVTDNVWGPIASNVSLPAWQTVNYTWMASPNRSVTDTVTAVGMYGFGTDTAPTIVSSTATATVTVNGTPPPAASIAYVYALDASGAAGFKSLLESAGYPVTLLPMSELSTADLSSFGLIIAGSDTGYGYSWGDAAAVAAVRTGRPVLGLGYGGACLFQQLGLSINWGNGWVGPLNQLYVVDPAHTIFTSPNVIMVPDNRIIQLYSSSNHIGEFAGYTSPGVLLLGREPDDADHYPIVQEQYNILWGFTASPANMTDDGKRLFLNVVAYAAALRASALPDLIITDFWRDGGRISYQIRNVGLATAPQGHLTSLSIDGVLVARDQISSDLAPGERLDRSFDSFTWVSTVVSNTLTVTADYLGVIVESDKTNNSLSAVRKYDETPPKITSGPQVSGVTQSSATIFWQTDEASDGLVKYSNVSGTYSAEKSDSLGGTSHSVTLLDLFPGASYHFVVRSVDASGNAVESRDIWFQTPGRTDAALPTVSMAETGVLSGVSKLTATASTNTEKVEFVIDGKLAFTAYGRPFEYVMDTTAFANGDHNISLNAVNSSGKTTQYDTVLKVINVNPLTPTVKILSPANGATVSGKTTIVVLASAEKGITHLLMAVDHWMMDGGIEFPMPYPTGGAFPLTLDTSAIKGGNGLHTLEIALWSWTEGYFRSIQDSISINVVNTPPPPPPKLVVTDHRATRKGNYFTVDVTVMNVGGEVARNIVIKDNLILFQPILSSSSLYDISTDLGGYNVACQNAIIRGKVDIPPGNSIDYAFDVVPVLVYPGGAYPHIGNAELELSWNSPTQSWLSSSSVSFPVVTTTTGEALGQAYDNACKTSDYLIVTSPENLQRFNAHQHVAALLSKMAELARLKDGVLGYLDVASSLPMTYNQSDGFAVGDVAADARAELIIGDHAGGEIYVYGLQSDVQRYSFMGPTPPVQWKLYAHFYCGENFAPGDKIALGKSLGKTQGQIVVAHGSGNVDLCEDMTPYLLTPIAPGTFVFGPVTLSGVKSEFPTSFQAGDGLAVGDVNGDGKDEIVVASVGNGAVYIYSGAGMLLRQFAFNYKAGDGFVVGDALGSGIKQIIVASAHWPQTTFILSETGVILDSFPNQFHVGDGIAVGDVITSFTDNRDEIVFADAVWDKVFVEKGRFEQGWGGQWFSRPIEPNYGLAVGNVFGGQGDDIVIADWSENSIDFLRAGVAAGDKHRLRDLVQASGGAWSAKLRSDWTTQGFLLIVGEPEIVPAWGGKTFGQEYTTDGWQELRADVTDYPYASTTGEDIKPELSIGRIVGSTAIELAQQIQTSIDAGNSLGGSSDFTVSGFPGAPPNNIDFKSEANKVAATLAKKGVNGPVMFTPDYAVYDAQGNLDVAATDPIVVSSFFANSTNKDILFLAGHGNAGSWDRIHTHDVWAQVKPFGSKNPFVYAASCLTGSYFDPYSIAKAFLQRGAGTYLGATNWGLGSHAWISNYLFDVWTPGEPFGQTVKKVKASIVDDKTSTIATGFGPDLLVTQSSYRQRYWAGIYHVLGDPKFGMTGASNPASSLPSILAGAFAAIIGVPDYKVNSIDGLDHVTIPGGQVLAVPGLPEVPSYRVTFDVPKGLQVQNVTLQSRSDPIVPASGLNIPNASLAIVGQSGGSMNQSAAADLVDWWPRHPFDWALVEGPANNRLAITVYPFDYNPLTTGARFYKDFTFTVFSTESPVVLDTLITGKESFLPGEPVTVFLALENNGAEAKDVIVSATVRSEGTGGVVGGLPVRTLQGLKGKASYSGNWNSSGFPPGHYDVQIELRDVLGALLDRKTKTFRLDAPAGEITQFSATPQTFNIGNSVALSLTFKNMGTQDISGLAVVKVLDASQNPVAQFSHEITGLTPAGSVIFDDVWNTAQAAPGSYTVAGLVLYDGKTSRTAELLIESNTPHAEAGPDQTVERSGPGGAQVTLDGSRSYSPGGFQLTYQWTWPGGAAIGVNPTVSLPMGNTIVTLNVSSGGASASDTVNIRVVDTTPPGVQIKIPASGEAVQDGPKITAGASDLSGVAGVYFWIRGPLGLKGASLGYDALAGTLMSGSPESGTWEYQFDSTKLADGYYIIVTKAVDNYGNEGWSTTVPFSIRNWSVIQMLPATPNSNAGRTMPVKFSLRIAQAVDPAQPFVHSEQLTVRISGGGQVLQTSVYGSQATDYRIDDQSKVYITNFQTQKTPMQYTVEVLRNGALIGSFSFATTK